MIGPIYVLEKLSANKARNRNSDFMQGAQWAKNLEVLEVLLQKNGISKRQIEEILSFLTKIQLFFFPFLAPALSYKKWYIIMNDIYYI